VDCDCPPAEPVWLWVLLWLVLLSLLAELEEPFELVWSALESDSSGQSGSGSSEAVAAPA
jgi:hypothetical protein